jgi:hypothetical protein
LFSIVLADGKRRFGTLDVGAEVCAAEVTAPTSSHPPEHGLNAWQAPGAALRRAGYLVA